MIGDLSGILGQGCVGSRRIVRCCQANEVKLTGRRLEIILTDTPGEQLHVDVLAYPEDRYLVVDPYSPLEEPQTSVAELIARAETTLPRPLGEILPAPTRGVEAKRLLRLILLDFNQSCPCRADLVEKTLRQLIHEGAQLKAGHLALDRFELLKPCISAYRVLSCLDREVGRLESSGSLPPKKLIFSARQPALLRQYELALANLRRDRV